MDSDDEHKGVDLDTTENFTEKKKRRRGGKKKKGSGVTGFEEYYADPPTPPEEALRELQELYASSIPFEQRIQTCIHRYRTRRRFNSELNVYFSEYMFLGGIDTTDAAFNAEELEDGSLIPHAAETPTTSEQDDEAANTRLYDGNARNWTVDFTSVVAGFLSISILPLTCLEPEPTARAISLVENFLRYVLQHDVCPEHAVDVRGALAMCARARDEWPRLCRFQSLLPGRFNLAAAQTFGVHEETDWSLRSRKEPEETLSPELVFYASLVAAGQPVPKMETGQSDLRLSRQFSCSLALQSVEMPTSDITNYFRRLALGSEAHKMLNLQPLGRAVFRPTAIEDGWVRQIPPETLPEDEDAVLFFERDLLAEMTVGMKVTAQVCELSSGFRFVKTLEQVQPSFYTFLPQHLIKDYKPPRANDRPPPSIHDRAAAVAEEPQEEEAGEE